KAVEELNEERLVEAKQLPKGVLHSFNKNRYKNGHKPLVSVPELPTEEERKATEALSRVTNRRGRTPSKPKKDRSEADSNGNYTWIDPDYSRPHYLEEEYWEYDQFRGPQYKWRMFTEVPECFPRDINKASEIIRSMCKNDYTKALENFAWKEEDHMAKMVLIMGGDHPLLQQHLFLRFILHKEEVDENKRRSAAGEPLLKTLEKPAFARGFDEFEALYGDCPEENMRQGMHYHPVLILDPVFGCRMRLSNTRYAAPLSRGQCKVAVVASEKGGDFDCLEERESFALDDYGHVDNLNWYHPLHAKYKQNKEFCYLSALNPTALREFWKKFNKNIKKPSEEQLKRDRESRIGQSTWPIVEEELALLYECERRRHMEKNPNCNPAVESFMVVRGSQRQRVAHMDRYLKSEDPSDEFAVRWKIEKERILKEWRKEAEEKAVKEGEKGDERGNPAPAVFSTATPRPIGPMGTPQPLGVGVTPRFTIQTPQNGTNPNPVKLGSARVGSQPTDLLRSAVMNSANSKTEDTSERESTKSTPKRMKNVDSDRSPLQPVRLPAMSNTARSASGARPTPQGARSAAPVRVKPATPGTRALAK
ncbi:hypothetical protein PFISCL1PPCAC_26373, partial [Pristionchus fissidentatus]